MAKFIPELWGWKYRVALLRSRSEHTAVLQALVRGIDPGVTDIFTAVGSGFSSLNGRIKKASIKEYHHICGLNLATQRRMQHQQYNQEDVRFISKSPTLKTPDLIDFSKAASIRLKTIKRFPTAIVGITGKRSLLEDDCFILAKYTFRLIKLNFKSYIKNKKLLMRLPKDRLMILSSTTVKALFMKRNSTVAISKNGSHLCQR